MTRPADECPLRYGQIFDDEDYYALTLTSNGKQIQWAAQTHFVGFDEQDLGIELREASLVKPRMIVETWALIGQPAMAVNTQKDLSVFLILGGNAVVRAELARKKLPNLLAPVPSVRPSPSGGFSASAERIKAARRRHPTPKQRMSLLRRDEYRCRICGRNADDALDLRLHVHHIHEYAAGGPTFDWNLITVCQTCHEGVGSEDRWELEARVGSSFSVDVEKERQTYIEGVRQYRELVERLVRQEKRKTKATKSNET